MKLEPPLATAAPPVAEEPAEPSSLGRLLPLEPAGEDARDELLDSSRDGLELPSPLPEAPSRAACADAWKAAHRREHDAPPRSTGRVTEKHRHRHLDHQTGCASFKVRRTYFNANQCFSKSPSHTEHKLSLPTNPKLWSSEEKKHFARDKYYLLFSPFDMLDSQLMIVWQQPLRTI